MLLDVCLVATLAFLPSTPPVLHARRPATPSVRLQSDRGRFLPDGDPRQEDEIIESVKVSFITSVAGTFASLPVKASERATELARGKISAALEAQWTFNVFAWAIELALFGVVYRCIVRNDDNTMLRQGAVGAAALCRALSITQVRQMWSSEMWIQVGANFLESAFVFGMAAWALETAFDWGYAYRLPGEGLPRQYFRDDFFGGMNDFGGRRRYGPERYSNYRNANYRNANYRDEPPYRDDRFF